MATAPAFIDPELAELDPQAMANDTGIDEDELVDALRREAEAAESGWDNLSIMLDLAHNFYEAKPFNNEVDGRSQIVLPDVQEVIDDMVPIVLRVFVSGEKVAEFEATDESEVEVAEEASAAVSYSFMKKQDGYRVLLDWLTNGLLEKIGITETMVVTEERVIRERIVINDPVELETIDGEIEDAEENGQGGYTLSIKRVDKVKRFVDESVPASEFRFSTRARHEEDADYLARCPIKTRSELVEMGFDRDQAYAVAAYSALPKNEREEAYEPDPESTPALQQVELRKEYAKIDLDGDGIAERVLVYRVENEIMRWADKSDPHPMWGDLAIEMVEEQPFSIFCPFPRPNRIVGWSLTDKVMDVQLGRSTIARQLFDGLYQSNMPRPIVETRAMDENTIDDLLSPIAGAPIRVASAGGVVPYQTNFDVGKSLTVMEWFSREREARSGTSRTAQTLDPNSLNNQTATEYSGDREDGQTRQEFVTRNFAEAFVRLLMKKYRLMKREGVKFKAKVNGQYKVVDPATWPEDFDVDVKVGLGRGSKDKRVQGRMVLAPILAEGFQSGQVEKKHLFKAVDGLVRDLGLGRGSDFWIDPDAPPEIDPQTGQPVQKEEKPDPEALAAQAEQQREDAKFQAEQQRAQVQMDMDREKAAAQLQLERDKASAMIEAQRERHALEMEQKREAAMLDMQLAEQRAQAEADIAVYRIDREAEVKAYAARVAGKTDDSDIGQNREGGSLDA